MRKPLLSFLGSVSNIALFQGKISLTIAGHTFLVNGIPRATGIRQATSGKNKFFVVIEMVDAEKSTFRILATWRNPDIVKVVRPVQELLRAEEDRDEGSVNKNTLRTLKDWNPDYLYNPLKNSFF